MQNIDNLARTSPTSHCYTTLLSMVALLMQLFSHLICEGNKTIFWMVLALRHVGSVRKTLEPTGTCQQQPCLSSWDRVGWMIRTPVEWLTVQPPLQTDDTHSHGCQLVIQTPAGLSRGQYCIDTVEGVAFHISSHSVLGEKNKPKQTNKQQKKTKNIFLSVFSAHQNIHEKRSLKWSG